MFGLCDAPLFSALSLELYNKTKRTDVKKAIHKCLTDVRHIRDDELCQRLISNALQLEVNQQFSPLWQYYTCIHGTLTFNYTSLSVILSVKTFFLISVVKFITSLDR